MGGLTPGSHLSLGEVKKGKVSGFHNWIRFYLLEKQGIVNYFSHNFNGPVSDPTRSVAGGAAPAGSLPNCPHPKWDESEASEMLTLPRPLCLPLWTLGWRQGGKVQERRCNGQKGAPKAQALGSGAGFDLDLSLARA